MFDNVRVRFELGCKVLPGILALGIFEHSGYSLVAVAASGDKVLSNQYRQIYLSMGKMIEQLK